MAAPAPFYPYGTGFGYPQYFAPTVFSGAVAPSEQQVNDAASQSVSVAPDATAAFAGSYFLPSTQLVPVQAPRVRRPGYNERLVAWRNRQKAFNRYKKATKEAIKNANKAPIAPAYPTVFGAPFAAPATYAAPTAFAASTFAAPQVYSYGAPFGATYLPYTFEQQQAPAQAEQYATFQDFSQAGVQEAVEEPEIRGTQV